MARLILVTGGSRSGKSAFAQELAEAQPPPRIFVATCPVVDTEMAARIRRHQALRDQRRWRTVEEETGLVRILEQLKGSPVVLVDCLTLWVNNLVYRASCHGREPDEEAMALEARRLCQATDHLVGTVIMVTGEVGSAVVPENRLARLYRDLVGRVNQEVARAADEVYLVVCGLPQRFK